MTLVRVYKKNGRPVHQNENSYRFSDMFNDFFGEENYRGVYSDPKVNVIEEKEHFELEIAIPGVSKDDISIDVENDNLNISHKEKEESEKKAVYNRREFDYSHFERSFHLPKTIDSGKIKARMDNGILTINLPKREEAIDRGPREIKIS